MQRSSQRTSAAPSVLQVGANSHGTSIAHAHDPVPFLISHGWSAMLIEPQPQAAAALRDRYSGQQSVNVRQEAVCESAAARWTTLWLINVSKTFGANHSDARCLGDLSAISGTASLSRRQVTQFQRFYRFTPSQCAKCAQQLGRPLPPSCMSRVYLDNLENISVPCAQLSTITAAPVEALVVDAEGQDADIVRRYLDLAGSTPRAIVYEHAHLRRSTRASLAERLTAAGMVRATDLATQLLRGRHAALRGTPTTAQWNGPWAALRHALKRVDSKDNSVWLLNSTGSRDLIS